MATSDLVKNYDLVLERGMEMIEFYRNNPVIAAYDLLRIDLAPIQRIVFEDMWFKNYAIVVASRGFGKTYLLAVLSCLSCLLYPGYRVGLIAPVFRQCFPLVKYNHDVFWTDKGLISDVYDLYNSIEPGRTHIQSLYKDNVVLNKWKNPVKDCIKITTEGYYEISGTEDHKVLVLDKDYSITYKELKNITKNDCLIIRHGFNLFGTNDKMPASSDIKERFPRVTKYYDIPTDLTSELAYFLGLLFSESYVKIYATRMHRVVFITSHEELLNKYVEYFNKYFPMRSGVGRSLNLFYKNKRFEAAFFSQVLATYLLENGLVIPSKEDLALPACIKSAKRELVIAFLRGLFDARADFYFGVYRKDRFARILYPKFIISLKLESKKLLNEVRAILLNLGLHHEYDGKFTLVVEGAAAVTDFYKVIGTDLELNKQKFEWFQQYVDKTALLGRVPILDTDGFLDLLIQIIARCSQLNRADYVKYLTKFVTKLHRTEKCYFSRDTIVQIIKICDDVDFRNDIIENLCNLIYGFKFVRPVAISKFKAPSIDIEVSEEACYWANGFINHNSKLIFSEIEKLYARSSILREACDKRPVRGSDTCYLRFKSARGMSPSYIEALPLGDGGKIRGSRFYLIVVDELAQIPDKILDMVIRPMAATTLEPMENVRRLERQKKLLELGLATEDDFDEITVNKMIMTSSGFYKFNHMWRRMKDYWRQIDSGKKDHYAVWQIPYWNLPEGFLDKNNIEEAKRVMSDSEFKMEYEALMVSDSEGFFRASLLEACTVPECFLEGIGDPNAEYILGVDPAQGGSASCGMVLIKLGNPNRIVSVLELKRKTTQELTRAIQSFDKMFNVVKILMDRGGGGKAIADLLEDGFDGYDRIIDRLDNDKLDLPGKHTLELIYFNPNWIADANFTTLSLLEDRKLIFSGPSSTSNDLFDDIYESIKELKKQMLNIIVTQTSTGVLHFDTPRKGQNKDLYSALILAAYGVRSLHKEREAPDAENIYTSSGLIRPHQANAPWKPVGNVLIEQSPPSGNFGIDLSVAVLKKNKRK